MNNLNGIPETLALLDALKAAANDFAAREEKLNQEFTRASNKEINSFEAATATLETRLSQFSAASEAELDRMEERRKALMQRRTIAINRAHAAARKQAERASEEFETNFSNNVRSNTAQAERQREEALAAQAAWFQNFQQTLNDSAAALAEQEAAARKAFSGFGKFRRWLGQSWTEPDFSPDENGLLAEFNRLSAKSSDDLKRFGGRLGPLLFRLLPVWLLGAVLLAAGATPLLARFQFHLVPPPVAYGCLAGFAAVLTFYWLASRSAAPLAKQIAADLFKARRLLDGCYEKSAQHHTAEQQRIKDDATAAVHELNRQWKQHVRETAGTRLHRTQGADDKASRAVKRNAEFYNAAMEAFKRQQAEAISQARVETTAQLRKLSEAHNARMADLKGRQQAEWQALEADWKKTIEPLWSAMGEQNALAKNLFPVWSQFGLENWTPPAAFTHAAKFATLEVNLPAFAEKAPKDKRLAFPGPKEISLPMALVFPQQGSVLFETGQAGAGEANAAINNLIFRLLAAAPPGRLSFTIFDPVGLGQNFASLMHLADYEESSLDSRIWTQTGQFEEKLAELNEHMEKVIQMYLRNEYATIAEYNAKADATAEKYHFLIIASFPAGFSDTAAKRLRNIAANGARCGVYTFIQWDARVAPPADAGLEELRKNSLCLARTERGFEIQLAAVGAPSARWNPAGLKLMLDAPPEAEVATRFLHLAGKSSKGATRVEVPFATVAPPDSEMWTEETVEELRVPIGRSGAAKLQYLAIGKATRQHALIGGKTGSGKSTLFHVIVTNLALRCSPEQVEFYLVDFKKGVEFKCYATRKLPHARVVAIESDREFGLSVLQRVDDELRRRGDLFRKVGAQDLPGYMRSVATADASQPAGEPMPRLLLMIDEFQEFFTEEDRVSQGAAVLLDRIVRQGRAFGIHVILGSQTLGGAYTLARATIGQMVIRVALQCNEADAYLIMDQDNPAPRLLSRPGEGIYNDAAGAIEGNSPFQAVWLSDTERDQQLAKVRARADGSPDKYPGPIVFEGNAPADVQDNAPLAAVLQSKPAAAPAQARIWLGAPNSIKGPTEVTFRRQGGNNLLIVGQSEERALTGLALAMISLAAQFPAGKARFVTLDSSAPGSPEQDFFQQSIRAVPHETAQANNASLGEIFGGLAEELKRRNAEDQVSGPEIFVLIHGLQNFKKLRTEDEFSFSSSDSGDGPNPAAILGDLLRDGSARGIHVLATCDTYNSVNRFLGRKTLSEFEARVLFQMSAADSASLIDDPAAGSLGLYRALLYSDREGTIETFRPYAKPSREWIENVAQRLAIIRQGVSSKS